MDDRGKKSQKEHYEKEDRREDQEKEEAEDMQKAKKERKQEIKEECMKKATYFVYADICDKARGKKNTTITSIKCKPFYENPMNRD